MCRCSPHQGLVCCGPALSSAEKHVDLLAEREAVLEAKMAVLANTVATLPVASAPRVRAATA